MMNNQTEIIWKDFHKKLKQFIVMKVRNTDDADDILQDVFIRIHNKIDTLKNSRKLESWIYQIARNSIIDYYRKKKNFTEIPESLKEEDTNDNKAAKRISPSVIEMINELPYKYKEALLLTEFKGLKQRELAESLGLSLPGAKSRVQRAREQLKEMLLDCCHFELDKYGNIIDYCERNSCCKKLSRTKERRTKNK